MLRMLALSYVLYYVSCKTLQKEPWIYSVRSCKTFMPLYQIVMLDVPETWNLHARFFFCPFFINVSCFCVGFHQYYLWRRLAWHEYLDKFSVRCKIWNFLKTWQVINNFLLTLKKLHYILRHKKLVGCRRNFTWKISS